MLEKENYFKNMNNIKKKNHFIPERKNMQNNTLINQTPVSTKNSTNENITPNIDIEKKELTSILDKPL